MKKIVNTHNDLLISLASKGDPVAFYALISPSLEKNYVKMRINGKSHSDTCDILFSDALTLFNSLKKSAIPDNFNEWVSEQNLINEPDQETDDQKLSSDQKLTVKQFSLGLQRHLVRMTSDRKCSRFSNTGNLFSNPWFKYSFITASVLVILLSLYFIFYFSNSALVLTFKTSENEYGFSFPFKEKTQNTENTVAIDSSINAENSDSASQNSDDSLSNAENKTDKAATKSIPVKKKISTPKPASPPKRKPVFTPKPKPIAPVSKPKPKPKPKAEPVQKPASKPVSQSTPEPAVSEPASVPAVQPAIVNDTEPDETSDPQPSTSQSSYSEPESVPYSD